LQLQIADLLFVDEEGVRVDQERASGELLFFEQIGEFDAAFGEESHFQSRDTAKAPPGIGDGLDELTFTETDRQKLLLEGVQMALVAGGVIAEQENRAAGESGDYCLSLRLAESRGLIRRAEARLRFA